MASSCYLLPMKSATLLTVIQVRSRADGWRTQLQAQASKKTKTKPSEATEPTGNVLDKQLEFMAHVAVYVSHLHNDTKLHGNSQAKQAPTLKAEVPIYGPRFVPPTHLQTLRRKGPNAPIVPETAYLRPINIVHPFYYPQLALCPDCKTDDEKIFKTNSQWTAGCPRKVHGLSEEEYAYGVQYHCSTCKKGSSTTNPEFWKGKMHWQAPSMFGSQLPDVDYLTDSAHSRSPSLLQEVCCDPATIQHAC